MMLTCVCEDCRSSDDNTKAMRNDGVVSVIALWSVCLDIAGNGVGQAMTQVDPSIAKPYAGKCAGQVHGRPGQSEHSN